MPPASTQHRGFNPPRSGDDGSMAGLRARMHTTCCPSARRRANEMVDDQPLTCSSAGPSFVEPARITAQQPEAIPTVSVRSNRTELSTRARSRLSSPSGAPRLERPARPGPSVHPWARHCHSLGPCACRGHPLILSSPDRASLLPNRAPTADHQEPTVSGHNLTSCLDTSQPRALRPNLPARQRASAAQQSTR